MHESTSNLRFWLLNALAWLGYAVFSLFLGHALAGGISSGIVLISGVLAMALWLCSGALRAVAIRWHWWDGSAPLLLCRLGFGVLAGATLAQLAVAAALVPALQHGWVQLAGSKADYRPAAAMVYWINTAIMLTLWTGVWAGLHSLRRARRAELAHLRAEAARSALERDALRARLNPHFVFNALNNLRALIHEDPERAREMVTRLSRTLRHALEHGAAERVALDAELAVVRDYLAIESVHYEDRLRIATDIAPGCGDAQLPAMALQLLVENAIKHGIAVRPGGGELRIQAGMEGDVLRLVVCNPQGHGAGACGHGVGLAYLRAQLAGTRGRFELQPQGDRMRAVLEIPQ